MPEPSTDRPPRLLITTSTFPVRLDAGTPRFVFDLSRALSRRARVTVLAPGAPGAPRFERTGGLEIHRFTYFLPRSKQVLALGRGMRHNLRGSWLARLQVPLLLARQVLTTRRLIRNGPADVVNAHWIVPQGLTAAWACRRAGVPLLLQVHGGDVFLLRRLPLGRAVARYVLARTDALFVAGSYVRDCLNELVGYDSRATLRPMGVDCATFAKPHGSDRPPAGSFDPERFQDGFLLFVGRLIELKGLVYLVRALPRVLQDHPGIGLLVAGDGPERASIEREVRRLNLQESVALLGQRPHEEIAWYLRRCRVAVVPSILDQRGETEGMPTVVVEAMAAGARVVGTDVDGIPDLIRHGRNGWLCRDQDPQDLAAAILAALHHPSPASVSAAAVETARGHDWSEVAAAYLGRIERLLESTVR